MIFEGERDVSLLKADRKGPDERKWFKDARREGCWMEDAGPWEQVLGLPKPRRPQSLPSDRAEGEEGRTPAVRFGGS